MHSIETERKTERERQTEGDRDEEKASCNENLC